MREEVIFEVWRLEFLLSLCHCTDMGQVKREHSISRHIATGTTNFANFADFAADFATFPKI